MLGRTLNSAMPLLLVSLLTSVGCSTFSLQKGNPLSARDERADSQMSLARLYERKSQPEQAEQLYRQVLAKDPKSQDAHHRLGVMNAKRNRFDEAQKHFEMALSLGPAKVELLNDIGYSLYLQDRLPEAEQVLRKSLAQNPQNRQAMNNLGLVLGQLGRTDETFALFKQADGEAEAYANMAYVHAMQADLQSATRDYGRALSINPELRTAANGAVQIASEQRKRESMVAQRMNEQRRAAGPQGPGQQALAARQQQAMGAPQGPMMPPQQAQPQMQANPATALAEVLPGRQFPAGRPMGQEQVVMPAQMPLLPAEPATEFETVASTDPQPAARNSSGMKLPVALPSDEEPATPQTALAQANAPASTMPKVEPITPAAPVLAPEHRPGPPLVLHAGPADGEFAAVEPASESREQPVAQVEPTAIPVATDTAVTDPSVGASTTIEPATLSQSAMNVDKQLPAAVSNTGADMFGSLSTAVTSDSSQPQYGISRASYVAAPPAQVAQTVPNIAPAQMQQQMATDQPRPGVERAFADIVTNSQPPVQPNATNKKGMATGNLFAPTQPAPVQPRSNSRYQIDPDMATASDR